MGLGLGLDVSVELAFVEGVKDRFEFGAGFQAQGEQVAPFYQVRGGGFQDGKRGDAAEEFRHHVQARRVGRGCARVAFDNFDEQIQPSRLRRQTAVGFVAGVGKHERHRAHVRVDHAHGIVGEAAQVPEASDE